jgi:hypothetical protein
MVADLHHFDDKQDPDTNKIDGSDSALHQSEQRDLDPDPDLHHRVLDP